MTKVTAEPTSYHIVAIPYPGRGHINPMMNVCKQLLVSCNNAAVVDIRFTFLLTEEWVSFISAEPRPPQIQLLSIPNVIPSELVRGLDHTGFLESVCTKMADPIGHVLDQLQLDSPVTAIIADTVLSWAVSVGNQRKVPVVSLWTMSPSVFSTFYHFDLLIRNGHYPVDLSEQGDEVINYIPGIAPTRLADLPVGMHERVLGRLKEAFAWVRKAQSLLFTSFHELETNATETLMALLPFPVYTVGPSIPHVTIGVHHEIERDPTIYNKKEEDYYLKWLNSQPKNSVLYVSFGSFLSASAHQMAEILAGLHESGVRYLLVKRGDDDSQSLNHVQNSDRTGTRSLVVPWCNQLSVLSHPSVGGFLTHCGWNSTLEGIYAGVPMLGFPLGLDQISVRKLIVDDWRVGMKVTGAEKLVTRKEFAEIVKKFIDLDSEENKGMRKRASELKESCRQAITKGGSSDTNLNSFIREIIMSHD